MTKEADSTNKMSRREMFSWFGKRSLETALFIGLTEVGLHIKQTTRGIDEPVNIALDNMLERETGVPLQVKHYSFEILYATALQNLPSDSDSFAADSVKDVLVKGAGGIVANAGIGYALKDQDPDLNSFVGAASAIAARTVDLISTNAFIKRFEDPRFREYGFSDYYFLGEANPTVPDFPTEEQLALISFVEYAPLVLTGWILPFIGRNYLGVIPFVAKSNLDYVNFLNDALNLGDEVKSLIKNGATNEYISNYLRILAEEANSIGMLGQPLNDLNTSK